MWQISKEAYKNCEIEIINNGKYFRINSTDLGIESGYKNWAVIFDKCDLEKQKYRYELMPNIEFQPCRRFVRNDLVEMKIKSRKVASKQFLEFNEKLELDPYEIKYDEQDIISAFQFAFEG